MECLRRQVVYNLACSVSAVLLRVADQSGCGEGVFLRFGLVTKMYCSPGFIPKLMDREFERDAGVLEKRNGKSMVYFTPCKCDALLPCPVLMLQKLYIAVTLLGSYACPSSVV